MSRGNHDATARTWQDLAGCAFFVIAADGATAAGRPSTAKPHPPDARVAGLSPAMVVASVGVSARRGHHHLDHLGGRLQPRLDAGARRPTAAHDPGVPHLVEL